MCSSDLAVAEDDVGADGHRATQAAVEHPFVGPDDVTVGGAPGGDAVHIAVFQTSPVASGGFGIVRPCGVLFFAEIGLIWCVTDPGDELRGGIPVFDRALNFAGGFR